MLAEAAATATPLLGGPADLTLRFLPDGGPDSGAVRVELTPESRPLTMLEARAAAEQGFLEALTEPGLGDGIRRITVVVRLTPAGLPGGDARKEVFVFVHKGGKEWSVLAGE